MKVIAGGETIDLGTTLASPTISIVDFSRRVTDDFGVTTVVERGFARRMSVQLLVPFDEVDSLQQQLALLRATPAQWIADARFDWLSINGFYKEFNIDLAAPPTSYCTLTVEGLAETEVGVDTGGDPAPGGRPSTLRLLQPVAVTDSALVASNVPQSDHPAWSVGTTYPLGARVIKIATHRIYESAIGGNAGNDPEGASGQWIDIGPTNRWAMFDEALGTSTIKADGISVTLNSAAADSVALLDVVGTSVRVQTAGYDRTLPVGSGAITFLDLPGTGGQITVTISGTGPVSVGTLLVGRTVSLGETEANPSAGINDFSRKETDDFGEVTIVERAWAKRMSAQAVIRNDAVDLVANRIAAVRARPALWIGNEGTDSLTVYGFFRNFSIEIGQTASRLSLSIEGLSQAAPLAAPAPLNWTDIVDNDPVERPRPDDGATDGATLPDVDDEEPGNLKKPNGAPWVSEELLNRMLLLQPAKDGIALALPGGDIISTIRAADTGAAEASALAQRDRQLDRMGERIVEVLAQRRIVDRTFRDAGIVTDPASGKARLYALEETQNRVTDLSLELDAQKGQLALRATQTYVNNAIAEAVIDPTQVPVFQDLEVRISGAEVLLDAQQAAILQRATVVDLSAATGRISETEQRITAAEGAITNKVESTEFDALETRVTTAEVTITALGDVSSITEALTAVTWLPRNQREADERAVMNLAQMRADRSGALGAIADARRELTAKVNGDISSEALARQQLAARVNANAAGLASEQLVRSTQFGALSQTTTQLSARMGAAEGEIDGERNARIADVNDARQASVDGDAVVAQSVTNLSARVDGAEGAIDGERDARVADVNDARQASVDGDAVVAQSVTNLSARVTGAEDDIGQERSDREAAVSAVDLARVTADNQLAQQIGQVSTKADDNEVKVTSLLQSENANQGRFLFAVEVSNDGVPIVTGIEGFGDSDGTSALVFLAETFVAAASRDGQRVPFFTVTAEDGLRVNTAVIPDLTVDRLRGGTLGADIDIGAGRITARAGGFMKVQGTGFGTAGQFLEWYGPERDPNQCDEASALYYLRLDGDAYFGGTLSAGILTNRNSTSSLAADASVELGPFGTNGNPIVVSYSYQYSRTISEDFAGTSTGLANFENRRAAFNAIDQGGGYFIGTAPAGGDATVILKKGEAQVSAFSVSGGVSRWSGVRPIPAEGIPGSGTTTTTLSGGATYTDNAGGVADRTFTAALTSRSVTFPSAIQRITIIATEE